MELWFAGLQEQATDICKARGKTIFPEGAMQKAAVKGHPPALRGTLLCPPLWESKGPITGLHGTLPPSSNQ